MVTLRLILLCAAISACAPQIPAALGPPADWRAENYVSGLTISVPPDARVARPQGIDSSVMEVRGSGYSLDFDNFGEFRGPANTSIGGRSAVRSEKSASTCVQKTFQIELREPSPLTPPLCDSTGKNCTRANGVAQIYSRCVPGHACQTVEQMIASIRFVPPPYPQHRVDENYKQPPGPVCRMPGDD